MRFDTEANKSIFNVLLLEELFFETEFIHDNQVKHEI